MVLLILLIFSLSLILFIFIQMPKDTIGLTNIRFKSTTFDSLANVDKLIKFITVIGIFLYLFFAIKLNSNL